MLVGAAESAAAAATQGGGQSAITLLEAVRQRVSDGEYWCQIYTWLMCPDSGEIPRRYPSADARKGYFGSDEWRKITEELVALLRSQSVPKEVEPTAVITLRLPASVHECLKQVAHEQRVSLNKLALALVLKPAEECEFLAKPTKATND